VESEKLFFSNASAGLTKCNQYLYIANIVFHRSPLLTLKNFLCVFVKKAPSFAPMPYQYIFFPENEYFILKRVTEGC
jgi:hypothetical protein